MPGTFIVSVHRFRVQRSGLGTRTKLKTRSPRKKCWFCHIIAKYHVPDPPASPVMYRTDISQKVDNGGQVCEDVKAVGFPVQNVYKMTYGDENATFESRCKRETFEPVNGYHLSYEVKKCQFMNSIARIAT